MLGDLRAVVARVDLGQHVACLHTAAVGERHRLHSTSNLALDHLFFALDKAGEGETVTVMQPVVVEYAGPRSQEPEQEYGETFLHGSLTLPVG